MFTNKKKLGIIGGMGPAATALLFQKIIEYTDAGKDSEHIPLIIDNNTAIPDRTTAIMNGDKTPVVQICESGKRLIHCGAQMILIPCNTSHYFYQDIQAQLSVPVVNMISEVAKECVTYGYKKVGILATTGTCKTGIYDKTLSKYGIEAVYPTEDEQSKVMELIYDQIKAGKAMNPHIVEKCLKRMMEDEVQAFILGCTELPIALKDGIFGCRFVDSLDILAKRAVELAGGKLKRNIDKGEL